MRFPEPGLIRSDNHGSKSFPEGSLFTFFEEDFPDIVRDREIWVENSMHNFSSGDPIVCDLCFGHNMKSDRAVKIEKVTPAVFGTWGKNHAVEVSVAERQYMEYILTIMISLLK
ncbi:MAG TPA: hypothetical protein HA262_04275 [Methanosarcina sp.]|nr:hypothetical protein [Methanosarcina sp.]